MTRRIRVATRTRGEVVNLPGDYAVDPATGLQNFFGFLRDATAAMATGSGVAIAFDVNDLHEVNVTYGRAMGDRVLESLAGLLAEAVAAVESGRAYRLRRDEFAALLPGVNPVDGREVARRVTERYRDRTAEMGLPSTIRSVVVAYPAEVRSAGDLLLVLDFSLYHGREQAADAGEVRPDQLPPWVRFLIDDMADRVMETVALLTHARELAFTDAVSGLPNHRAAEEHLARHLAEHAGQDGQLVVLFVDGDNLKAYNDMFGYEAGNEMIRNLGQVLVAGIRTGDYVARWLSGDEFLVVLPGTDRAQGWAVAERLRAAVEQESRNWPLPVTVSVGVAAYPADGRTAADLLRAAADANAVAKRRGRNRVE